MAHIFNIVDDTVVINKLALNYTSGSVVHTGSMLISGGAQLNGGLSVAGKIVADTIQVNNIVTPNGALDSIGEWHYDTEVELNGKGFTWAWADNASKLIFRTGNRLWTNTNLDLVAGSTYRIDDVPVLTANSLGPNILNSKLTSVGTLGVLTVSGDVTLSDFAFFSSTYNRFGIGTEEPNAAISVMENNVELVIGSPAAGVGTMGTYTSHDLSIVSDNIPRITAKANGEVWIGDAVSKTGVLRVYGTLYADSVQTDNRVNRTHPLEFISTVDTTVYGLGLVWSGTGDTKQFTLMTGTDGDRLWSTENIDLSEGKAFHVNGNRVLSQTTLGNTVTDSSLTSVGTLTSITVAGPAVFENTVTMESITANSVTFGNITLNTNGINTNGTVTISANDAKVVYSDDTQISIGDSSRTDKAVKVFGALSVGIANPDPSLKFSVNGDVNIGGKRFTTGATAPATGSFQVGDICWNNRPQASSYIGWVCVVAGDPGQWMPFGAINSQ